MIKTILLLSLLLASYSSSFAKPSSCQKESETFYKSKNYRPSHKSLERKLGKANICNSVRQLQYKWGNFYLITRDGDIVEKYGEIPTKLDATRKTYKSLDISHVIELLGKPDSVKKDILQQGVWICKDTGSKIEVIYSANNKIENYSGIFCDKRDPPMCASFSYENTIMLMD